MLADIIRRLNELELLGGEIEPGIAFGCPDVHLALGYYARTAGGQVRDATIGKCQSHIGNVFMVAKDRYPQGLDRSHGRLYERQQKIDVMNHEVENYANV